MTKELYAVVGLGVSGLSCIRYLSERGLNMVALDTRAHLPGIEAIQAQFPNLKIQLGPLDNNILDQATTIILSPGIDLQTPEIVLQKQKGKEIIGDIELFARNVSAPVIAITGTNAKSTVTTLVGLMAKNAQLNAAVGGNLGTPALDLLTNPLPDVYVLELSSFQLETLYSLQPNVAAILNITPDHLDRHQSLAHYQQAKLRIYTHCQNRVYNRDDHLTYPPSIKPDSDYGFTLQEPGAQEFGLTTYKGMNFLTYEKTRLLAVSELLMAGKHSQANALAALAIGKAFGLPIPAMLQTLQTFKGLPHRCQLVRELNAVKWYNDSKGTNVGATLAAIEGLGSVISGKIILIAGGEGKNADFTPLFPAIKKYTRLVILIGAAAKELQKALTGCNLSFANSMAEAVSQAQAHANAKDCVLLSPACASYDMFKNFEHRGQVFNDLVAAL